MKNKRTAKALTESAIMIALATVLSLLKVADMPYGGSVTVASALPIAIISYRYGLKWGLLSSAVYGIIQQLLGLSTLSYFTTWQSIVAIIVLDYIVAFTVIGLAGMFRKCIKNQAVALAIGGTCVCLLRYLCHVISGATVWAGLSIPDSAALIYSFIYNATYMVPETIVFIIAALYIGSAIDFKSSLPTRMVKKNVPSNVAWISPVAGLIACGALIFDVAKVFVKLQDADSGIFYIQGIKDVNWTAVGIVTAIAAVAIIVLLAIRKALIEQNNK